MVCCEQRDAHIRRPAWDTLLVDGALVDCTATAPSDVEKHPLKRAKFKWWKRKRMRELEEGAWVEPVRALRRKCDTHWTPKNAAVARSWVINAVITQLSPENSKICYGPGTEKACIV